MARRHAQKFAELFGGSRPLSVHRAVGITAVGLVPDLKVFDIIMMTVRPALVIVADDVLADPCPFRKILRRLVVKTEISLLHAGAETVDDIRSAFLDLLDIIVGKRKIVACGIVLVRIEIAENARDITAGVKMRAHIVEARKRNCYRYIDRDFLLRVHTDGRLCEALQLSF